MPTRSQIDKPVRREELSDFVEELCERRGTVDLLLREWIAQLSESGFM